METEKAAGHPNKYAQRATDNTCLYLRLKVMTEKKVVNSPYRSKSSSIFIEYNSEKYI